MAKSRGVVSGPRWPGNMARALGPTNTNPGTLDANAERIVFIGQVLWDDGATHVCDTIEWRAATNSIVGDVDVGLADEDAATGPPGRDDGTLTDYTTYTFNNPGAGNHGTAFTTGTSRSLDHGELICVVFRTTTISSGSLTVFSLNGQSSMQRPVCTSFLGGVYAIVSGSLPTFSFFASGDGHYGIMRGGVPHITASPSTVTVDSDTSIKRAALAFTVVAPVWGIEGEVLLTNVSGGDITISVYDGTDLMTNATMTIDANTWGADGQTRYADFCFPDVAFVASHTYYLAVVGAATACQVYTIEVTTDNRWDPLTGCNGGGTMGYATFDAAWTAVDESVLMVASWRPIAVDDATGGGGGNANILRGSVVE